MQYWWVNQNQTFEHEISGGYLWSPKREANGNFSQFYENMRNVEIGDVVFSYCDGRISQIGITIGEATTAPKPVEFKNAGANWAQEGWFVPVFWQALETPLVPKSYFEEFRSYLPEKYSPLNRRTGDGLQKVYLASVPQAMADILIRNINEWETVFGTDLNDELEISQWVEQKIEARIVMDPALSVTERQMLVKSRRGQGVFRQQLEGIERGCRVTGIANKRLLRASHTKPWARCENSVERLDPENGFLLTPTIDHLFDRGWLTFEEVGRILLSPRFPTVDSEKLGLVSGQTVLFGAFSSGQEAYLRYHREYVFKQT